jgi:hypothetical protein
MHNKTDSPASLYLMRITSQNLNSREDLKNLVQLIEMNGAPERQSALQATQILQKIQFPFYYVHLHFSDDQIYPPPRYFQISGLLFQKKHCRWHEAW